LYRFDGTLVDAVKVVFETKPQILSALDQSIHDPHCTKMFFHAESVEENFEHYQGVDTPNYLWNENVRVACALVKESLRITNLKPAKVSCGEDLLELFSNPKASPGVVGIGSTKRDCVQDCFTVSRKILGQIEDGVDPNQTLLPAMSFHRAQISGISDGRQYTPETLKMKDRLVWGIDGGTLAVEAPYAAPVVEHLSRVWVNYAGGKDWDDVRRQVHTCWRQKYFWSSTDYSKFDQTIPAWLLHQCFEFIRAFFSAEHHRVLDWVEYNFINTKIAIPGMGGIFQKHRGIPSGSNFTQVVGSMANMIMFLSYLASSATGEFQDKLDYVRRLVGRKVGDTWQLTLFVMGDDNLAFTSKQLDMQAFSEYVGRVFGVKIQPSKCSSGTCYDYPDFLKREWRERGEWQDPIYLLVNVCHPEHVRKYDGYSPWHILYGLYLTYSESFPVEWTERRFVEMMEQNGGVKALANVPRHELPGVLRAFGDKAISRMMDRAERLLAAS
jgi:hypothetical protein